MTKSHSFWRTLKKIRLILEKFLPIQVWIVSLNLKKLNINYSLGRKIFNGYFPISFIDLDLRSVVKYNNYEGFRFGLGGVTNTKLSEKYKIGGFVAYGLKNQKLKYGITPSYLIEPIHGLVLLILMI